MESPSPPTTQSQTTQTTVAQLGQPAFDLETWIERVEDIFPLSIDQCGTGKRRIQDVGRGKVDQADSAVSAVSAAMSQCEVVVGDTERVKLGISLEHVEPDTSAIL